MVLDSINDPQELRDHFGEPLHIAVAVEKPQLDKHHRRFIEHSPFICIASAGGDGQPAVSPKGDTPGFVKVIDDKTLLIPDRPGNNKVEGFGNMVENPKVSLIFFIPGITETLRIHGEAEIVLDKELLKFGKAGAKLPKTATLIKVTKAYMHCGKALIRSKLWDPRPAYCQRGDTAVRPGRKRTGKRTDVAGGGTGSGGPGIPGQPLLKLLRLFM